MTLVLEAESGSPAAQGAEHRGAPAHPNGVRSVGGRPRVTAASAFPPGLFDALGRFLDQGEVDMFLDVEIGLQELELLQHVEILLEAGNVGRAVGVTIE